MECETNRNIRWYCQKILPLTYDESLSYMEMVCKLIGKINETIKNTNDIIELESTNAADIAELNKRFEAFVQHGFDDYYAEQVAAWIDSHLKYVYDHTIKQVFFGLSDDGYFVAYIPDSWDDIEFGTIEDYKSKDYGKLTLSY